MKNNTEDVYTFEIPVYISFDLMATTLEDAQQKANALVASIRSEDPDAQCNLFTMAQLRSEVDECFGAANTTTMFDPDDMPKWELADSLADPRGTPEELTAKEVDRAQGIKDILTEYPPEKRDEHERDMLEFDDDLRRIRNNVK